MIAVDFESFYSRTHTVSDLGPWAYAHHPHTDIYMVSVYGEGIDYTGDPAAFDWTQLAGRDVVSHNAGFDYVMAAAGAQRGLFPVTPPRSWSCSADLMAYEGYPRALAKAAESSLGVTVDKRMRNFMSGKRWADAVAAGKDTALIDYARTDSIRCLELWDKHSPNWPDLERWLSSHTRSLIFSGVHVRRDKLSDGISHLVSLRDAAERSIPWRGSEKILSLPALRDYCSSLGIRPPSSLAKDSEECMEWEDRYGSRFPWIAALRDYRRTNMLLKKLESIDVRLRSDGTIPIYLKYFGCHTGRWSGDAGVNMQNMPRGELYGVNLREMFVPPPGKKFIICDLSQIEARVLLWLVGDTAMMDELRKGYGLYETHARQTMGWTGGPLKNEAPEIYQLAKARVLGLGFGCGPAKFQFVAKVMAGLDLTADECERTVYDWRRSNPRVPKFWRLLDGRLEHAKNRKAERLSFDLPSGRAIHWWQPRPDIENPGDIVINQTCANDARHIWGGGMTENAVQALAREIFAYQIREVVRAGIPVAWHIHDEMVGLADDADAEDALADMTRIMSTPPPWIPDIPLAAEGAVASYYTK